MNVVIKYILVLLCLGPINKKSRPKLRTKDRVKRAEIQFKKIWIRGKEEEDSK